MDEFGRNVKKIGSSRLSRRFFFLVIVELIRVEPHILTVAGLDFYCVV